MAPRTTVPQLRRALEERRRNTLGLRKALDRLGVSPTQLPAPTMREFAERDADCVGWLLRLAEMEPRSPADRYAPEIQSLTARLNQLESSILAARRSPQAYGIDSAWRGTSVHRSSIATRSMRATVPAGTARRDLAEPP